MCTGTTGVGGAGDGDEGAATQQRSSLQCSPHVVYVPELLRTTLSGGEHVSLNTSHVFPGLAWQHVLASHAATPPPDMSPPRPPAPTT